MQFIGLLLMLAAASAVPLSDVEVYDLEEVERHFEEFIQTFERNYETEEEKMMRLEVFKNNLKKINELNGKRTEEHHAVFGITSFSDYTDEEFQAFVGEHIPDININDLDILHVNDTYMENVPSSFDWRTQNKVTSIKSQNPRGSKCGSCWAFSAAACVESAIAIKSNKLLDLSEQQLVDCDSQSHGCTNGYPDKALTAYQNMGGINDETHYPYIEQQGPCRFDKTKSVARLNSFSAVNGRGQELAAFQTTLMTHGPMIIGISADNLLQYKGGIYEGDNNGRVGHAVLLVGYGSENGVTYWIIKNSWGTNWGEQGYLRIKAGVNTCNVAQTSAFFVTSVEVV